MAFETEGILHKVFDTESKTASFQAREFVIKHEGNYPQFIKFQLTQDRCDLISNFKEGDMIKVHFDLRGREWNEKYFTNLNAWRIEASQAQQVPDIASEINAPVTQESGFDTLIEPVKPEGGQNISAEDFDDLPF
ncbi:MAG: DUF3127 domain-containing protein [Saprospiraceae bacterium]|nr:DUF3127 domain-containing protein [Bacteroidia bacterium]MBT8230082.1 DUF3127 domain-containing protein [Bacteroidia bacterium]NNF22937.1 DUF3127 domain-containing protein [Saprospiraceae bacterium]NNK90582.1 DUF3127 domain-containing protein [Saprospiraceae bacterium]